MPNWRLLLLAFLAACQPIASFSEPNLFDGRQQCCDRIQDPRLSLDGIHQYRKASSEEHRLIQKEPREDILDGIHRYRKANSEEHRLIRKEPRKDIRENRRYGIRSDAFLSRSENLQRTRYNSKRSVLRWLPQQQRTVHFEHRQETSKRDRTERENRRFSPLNENNLEEVRADDISDRSRDIYRSRSSRDSLKNRRHESNSRTTLGVAHFDRTDERTINRPDISRRDSQYLHRIDNDFQNNREVRHTRSVLKTERYDVARNKETGKSNRRRSLMERNEIDRRITGRLTNRSDNERRYSRVNERNSFSRIENRVREIRITPGGSPNRNKDNERITMRQRLFNNRLSQRQEVRQDMEIRDTASARLPESRNGKTEIRYDRWIVANRKTDSVSRAKELRTNDHESRISYNMQTLESETSIDDKSRSRDSARNMRFPRSTRPSRNNERESRIQADRQVLDPIRENANNHLSKYRDSRNIQLARPIDNLRNIDIKARNLGNMAISESMAGFSTVQDIRQTRDYKREKSNARLYGSIESRNVRFARSTETSRNRDNYGIEARIFKNPAIYGERKSRIRESRQIMDSRRKISKDRFDRSRESSNVRLARSTDISRNSDNIHDMHSRIQRDIAISERAEGFVSIVRYSRTHERETRFQNSRLTVDSRRENNNKRLEKSLESRNVRLTLPTQTSRKNVNHAVVTRNFKDISERVQEFLSRARTNKRESRIRDSWQILDSRREISDDRLHRSQESRNERFALFTETSKNCDIHAIESRYIRNIAIYDDGESRIRDIRQTIDSRRKKSNDLLDESRKSSNIRWARSTETSRSSGIHTNDASNYRDMSISERIIGFESGVTSRKIERESRFQNGRQTMYSRREISNNRLDKSRNSDTYDRNLNNIATSDKRESKIGDIRQTMDSRQEIFNDRLGRVRESRNVDIHAIDAKNFFVSGVREIRTNARESRNRDNMQTRHYRQNMSNTPMDRSQTVRNHAVDSRNINKLVVGRDIKTGKHLNLATDTSRRRGNENEPLSINLKYVFYALQCIYLCSILQQIFGANASGKTLRLLNLWDFSSGKLIKVD